MASARTVAFILLSLPALASGDPPPAGPLPFAGRWVLDAERSDPPDALLKALGRGAFEQSAARRITDPNTTSAARCSGWSCASSRHGGHRRRFSSPTGHRGRAQGLSAAMRRRVASGRQRCCVATRRRATPMGAPSSSAASENSSTGRRCGCATSSQERPRRIPSSGYSRGLNEGERLWRQRPEVHGAAGGATSVLPGAGGGGPEG